jgi:DNA polymerase-3 subunit delta'
MAAGLFDDDTPEDDSWEPDEESGQGEAPPAGPGLLPPRLNPECLYHGVAEKNFLDYIAAGSMPHALIFAGPKGIGKATMAFRLARFLLKNGTTDAAQDSLFGDTPAAPTSLAVPPDDPVFIRVASGGHPDLLTLEKPEDKDEINVETARKIAPFLRMTASMGGWRVVIVDDADTMNRNGQNAILKILEEPPKNALLILITHRPGMLLPTIRSRCRVIPFQTMAAEQVASFIKRANPSLTAKDIEQLAYMAEGCPGRALEIMGQGGIEAVQAVTNLLSAWPNWDWVRIHNTADLFGRGNDAAYQGFRDMFVWSFENLLRAKAVGRFDDVFAPLKIGGVRALWDHYSLESLSQICDTVRAHFDQVDRSSLDRRHGVLGVFPLMASNT